MTKTIRINIPDEYWCETGWDTPGSMNDRLLAQVTINGTPHHLEAYRVAIRDGLIELANPAMESELMPTLQDLYDGGYEITKIRGGDYVLFMFPHAS